MTEGVAALRPVDAGIPTKGNRAYLAPRTSKQGEPRRHNGIDMLAPAQRRKGGEPVPAKARSVSKGVVTHAGESGKGFGGYGPQHVVVKTDGGVWLLYAHLGAVSVRPGDSVTLGSKIGTVDPGIAHLHFEVSPRPYPQRHTEARLDPVAYLSGGSTESTNTLPPEPDKVQEDKPPQQQAQKKAEPAREKGTKGPNAQVWGVVVTVVTSLVLLGLRVMLSRKVQR